jgi:hypothetical protein
MVLVMQQVQQQQKTKLKRRGDDVMGCKASKTCEIASLWQEL